MITRSRIRQLERRLLKTDKGEYLLIKHHISDDGRLLDKDGFVMTEEEVKQVAKEDQKTQERPRVMVFIKDGDPKLKPGSTTIPYRNEKNIERGLKT